MNVSSDSANTSGLTRGSEAIGLRLIVSYKFTKAVAEVLIGVVLLVSSTSVVEQLQVAAVSLRDHAVEAWSLVLAERLVRAATQRHVLVVGLAAALDGMLSFAEGWALHRRYRWSRWLVVGATSCLLPVEGVALVRHVSVTRIVLLCLNALIVIYLLRRKAAFAPDPR